MKNSNNYLNQAGKIFYEILKFPYNVLIGFWSPEYQQKLKNNKELKEKIKSLDYKIAETKSEKEDSAYRILEKINSNRKK